jgi:hypothetical protein
MNHNRGGAGSTTISSIRTSMNPRTNSAAELIFHRFIDCSTSFCQSLSAMSILNRSFMRPYSQAWRQAATIAYRSSCFREFESRRKMHT